MSNDIKLEMTEQRFAQLLASYGAEPERWPDAERTAALSYMVNNVGTQSVVSDAMVVDTWLQSAAPQAPAFAGLEMKLLQRVLPPRAQSLIDRLLVWLLPAPDLILRQLWRPVAVACLPLAIGLLVGFQVELAPEAYATSVEEELYLISLSDYAEIL